MLCRLKGGVASLDHGLVIGQNGQLWGRKNVLETCMHQIRATATKAKEKRGVEKRAVRQRCSLRSPWSLCKGGRGLRPKGMTGHGTETRPFLRKMREGLGWGKPHALDRANLPSGLPSQHERTWVPARQNHPHHFSSDKN